MSTLNLKPNALLIVAVVIGGLWWVNQNKARASQAPARAAGGVAGTPPSATGGIGQLLGGVLGGLLTSSTGTARAAETSARERAVQAVRINDPYYSSGTMEAANPSDFGWVNDSPDNPIGFWEAPATGTEDYRREW